MTTYVIPKEQMSLFTFDTPSMPKLNVSRCETRTISYETVHTLIDAWHYTHRTPGTVHVALGLYVDQVLAGAITYTPFKFNNIRAAVCGNTYKYAVRELSRLFIYDWCGRNTESWFIAQSFRHLRTLHPHIRILVSYADSGQNHQGYIYQATNWLYTGMSQAQSRQYVLPNGETRFRQARQFRSGARKDDDPLMSWDKIQNAYPGIRKAPGTRKHRYVYFLGSKSQRKTLRKSLRWPVLPYPKSKSTERRPDGP